MQLHWLLPVVLITAKLFGAVAARWGLPTVIGELAAGVFLGPALFGLVEPATSIGVTASVLDELGMGGSAESSLILGAAVLDDGDRSRHAPQAAPATSPGRRGVRLMASR